MTLDKTAYASDFVVSRFARLFPAYWAAMALTSCSVMAIAAIPQLQLGMRDTLINLTMLQGFFRIPSVDGVYLDAARLSLPFMTTTCMLGALGA